MVRASRNTRAALRTVAVFEAAKGLVVLLAGLGAFALVHRDVQAIAEEVVDTLGFDPASGYPAIFLDMAARAQDQTLLLLGLGALAYSAVRFAEGYGLWIDRAWAEWLGALSGAIYMPFEIVEITKRVTAVRLSIFALNVALVVFLTWRLNRRRRDRQTPQSCPG